MKSRQGLLGRVFRNGRQLLGCLLALTFTTALIAASVTYEYDDAGRLHKATFDNGTVVVYNLDAAGNRTTVQMAIPATPPATLTVPSSSTTGSYSISWTASPTSGVTGYQLWESTDSTFATQTLAWNGMSPASITGKGNGTYFYRIQACVSTLCGAYQIGSNSIVVTPPPGAPASISAPATNFTGAYSISWTAPTTGTVTRYEVDEATNPAFTSPSNIFNASGTNTSVSGRLTGTTYYYRVRACNGAVCGSYTASSGTAVTLLPAAPASITNPAGDPDGNYNVSWASVSGPLSAYELYEANNPAFTGAALVYNSTGTLISLTGRVTGTYYYRVRACNVAGCGGYTAGSGPTTVAVPPGAPASINAPATNFTGAYSISWTAPTTGTVTGYEVDEATNPAFTSPLNIFNANGTSTSVSGRLTATTYYYRVRACNGPGNCGPYTASSGTAVTLPPAAPTSLTNPAGDPDGTYDVTWSSVSGATTYEVYEALNVGFASQIQVYNGSGTLVTITGRPDQTYYYHVRACNVGGCSAYTAGSGPTTVTLPPGAPASITAPATNNTGAYSISWTAPTSGTVTRYEVDEATNASFTSPTNIFNALGTTTSVSGRATATTYYYRARACNGGVCGPYTASTGTVVTLPPVPPASLTNPTGDTDGTYDVTWSSVTGATSYEVYEALNVGFASQIQVYNGSGTLVTITGRPDQTYYYHVRACNVGGCSAYTAGSGPTTVAMTPAAPASITVPGSTPSGSYAINWTAPASGTVTGYELYESSSASYSPQTLVYSNNGTSTTLTNSGVTLYYRVRACNGAGNCGGYASGGPIVVAPPVPAVMNVPSTSSGSIALSWSTVSGTITAYEVYEATNPSFTGQVSVYSSTGSSTTLSRGNGTYYYQVRACNGTNCSGYRPGTTSAVVTIPPNAPPGIVVPPTSNGSHTISWTAGADTWDAFALYESTSSSFATQTAVYTSSGTSTTLSGRTDGTYYYRVQACYHSVCGGYATGATGTLVTNLPSVPPSISVPSSANGAYQVSWAGSTGAVTQYQLDESRNDPLFGGLLVGYTSTGTFTNITPTLDGSYYYRVRACNVSGCSGYRTGGSPTNVLLVPGAPPSVSVPTSSSTGNYTVSWAAASGTVTSYQLYESASPSFSPEGNPYNGAGTSFAFTANPTGTWYYRVRACNSVGCSALTQGANPITVSLPLPTINIPDRGVAFSGVGGTTVAYQLVWNGDIFATPAAGQAPADVGDWDSPRSAAGASFQATITKLSTGNCTSGPMSGTIGMASGISWSMTFAGTMGNSASCSFRIDVRDVATNTLQDTAVITLQAVGQ